MTSSPIVASLKSINRHYKTPAGTVKALDHVDMDIYERDFLAIAGPSGSGKSTLLNLVGMLDTPTDGKIILHDKDTASLSRTHQAKLRREAIGFIFQAYNLIPVLTVVENVEYVMMLLGWEKKKRRQRALEVLEQVGLQGLENRRPKELSGGQQQRVAVARAIAHKPKLVLADEPTANLDTQTGTALIDMMEHLNEAHGITFLFSSHDPKIIDRAKRLVQIRDGQISSDETRS